MNQGEPAVACPRDNSTLARYEERGLKCLRCSQCAGFFVDRSALLGMLPSGESSARVAALPESTVSCARCRVTMRMRVHRGTEVDVCPQCHSVWLDAGEWEGIVKPASTKGSKFGRTVTLTGAAAAAGVAVAAARGSADPGNRATATSTMADIGETVGDVAVDGVVEVVFEFVGEALSSIF